MNLEKKYYSTKDAATLSGLSQYELRKGCKEGRYPHVWCGRILKIDLEGVFNVLGQKA